MRRNHYWAREHHAPEDWTLTTYAFEEGPSPATGRRVLEDVGAFHRRKQVEELRKGGKNIFGPVQLNYTYAYRPASRPRPAFDQAHANELYAEAMRLKLDSVLFPNAHRDQNKRRKRT